MKILTGIWKLWFYFLNLVLVLLLAPFIIVLSYFQNTYSFIYKLLRIWAFGVFYGIGMRYHLHSIQGLGKGNYMIISNHTSLLDVMLMFILHPKHPLSFVAKKELEKIPLFGIAYRRVCVLVDRNSLKSRAQVYALSEEKMRMGRSMVIFPEGGVTERKEQILKPFKDGAFVVAQKAKAPIVAYTFIGLKEAFPFQFWKGGPRKIEVYREKIWPKEEVEKKAVKELSKESETLIIKRLIEKG